MEPQNDQLCASCYQKYTPLDVFCNGCGFPLQGSREEQDNHILLRQNKEIDLEELNKKIQKACSALYWIAGLTALFGAVIFATTMNDPSQFAVLITNIILVGAFLSFAVWSKTKPTTAMISGLSLYVIIIILNAIVSPITILSGIIFKILIIGILVKGIKSVMEAEKIKKELNIN